MLKRILFVLEKESRVEKLVSLMRDAAAHEIETYVCCAQDVIAGLPVEEGKSRDGTLYVTDSAVCQRQFLTNGLPVILYLHEENRGVEFLRAEYAIEQIEEIEYESLELAYLRLTGQPWMILTTDRCIIRETTIEDVDAFYEIYKEPSITYYMENLFADREEEIAYVRNYIKNVYGFYGYGMWTVLEKKSGEVIGRAGIVWREGFDIPELGFVIAVPYQRQGYAYEVCRAILAYAEKELDFHCVQAFIMEGNEKSRALCEKLGFVYREKEEIECVQYEKMVWDARG